MITAKCPKKCKSKQFVTTAHVMEEWKVDEHGVFLEVITNLETTHGPNPANIWSCVGCGAQAIVEVT
jgi:hypothetical protein